MLAELITELAGELFGLLVTSKKIPKAVRIAIVSALLLPLTVLMVMVSLNSDKTGARIAFAAVSLMCTAGYIALIRKILKDSFI